MTYKPKVIDFCCGAGGMSEGFRQACPPVAKAVAEAVRDAL